MPEHNEERFKKEFTLAFTRWHLLNYRKTVFRQENLSERQGALDMLAKLACSATLSPFSFSCLIPTSVGDRAAETTVRRVDYFHYLVFYFLLAVTGSFSQGWATATERFAFWVAAMPFTKGALAKGTYLFAVLQRYYTMCLLITLIRKSPSILENYWATLKSTMPWSQI